MTFKALALTFPGFSDICAQEIKQLTGISCKATAEGALFSTEKLEDLFTVCYRAQSASRVLLVISEGAFEQLNVPVEYLSGTISFTAKSSTKAQEFAETVTGKKVYKNADTPLYLHNENDTWWLGVDLAGDCSKRDYRIFIGSETLTGITCFGALLIAGYEPKQTLLDPFCRAGCVVIEAALHGTKLPVRHYSKQKLPIVKLFKDFDAEKCFAAQDKKASETAPGTILSMSPQFASVQATRKNAQIAGILKALDFSRTATDWLDLKIEKNSVDRIVTQPIEFTQGFPVPKAERITKELFHQSEYILKKNGKLCLILRKGRDEYVAASKAHGFALEHERTVMQGKESWHILLFSK